MFIVNARLQPRSAVLIGMTLLSHAPAGAQDSEGAGSFEPSASSEAPSAPPIANSESAATLLARLPAGAPAYFRQTYVSLMRAPFPAQIFNQGGIPSIIRELELDENPSGVLGSFQPDGSTVTASNAFFQELGTNGRSCATCHQPPSGMSISLRNIQQRFRATQGTDPLFAPVDGANCPNQVPESVTAGSVFGGLRGKGRELERAHSLLLSKGLIRIALPVPAGAEFTISVVNDPTTCNIDPDYNSVQNTDGSSTQIVSVFRRPVISTNLDFKTTTLFPAADGNSGNIMWDGREPTLFTQAVSATLGHAQALVPPTQEQLDQIVQFERRIFSAQLESNSAGLLDETGVTGGPIFLAAEPPGQLPAAPFDEFTAFAAATGERALARQSVARGQQLFSGKTFTIAAVAGFNDFFGPDAPPQQGTCATCHNIAHAGSDALPNAQRDIGVGGQAVSLNAPAPAADLPIFSIEGCPVGSFLADPTRTSILTNDPGRALITGRCRDVGAMTVPTLRGLASHEPYFHDGSEQTLDGVVQFYDDRFAIELTPEEKADLVAFLQAL
jgi:cytochrome c peroxidase